MSSTSETPQMRLAVGAVRRVDSRILRFASQLGVRGLVINTPVDLPGEERWELADLISLRERIEAQGLVVEAIENVPIGFYRDVILGGTSRDRQIENCQTTIENIGRAGIPVFGFHWMANEVWRSELDRPGRGGARVTAFDLAEIPDADVPTFGRRYEESEILENFERFVHAVVPIAEAVGVRLALHPDDPPVASIGGVARPFRNVAGLRRAVEVANSSAFGLEFCMGTVSSMGPGALEHLRWFAERGEIVYVHFRDVSGFAPSFVECFLGEGNFQVVEAMRLLQQSGFNGVVIDDHVPLLDGDPPITPGWVKSEYAYYGRAHGMGYLQGLLAGVVGSDR
jgi:mannonate dehydratase